MNTEEETVEAKDMVTCKPGKEGRTEFSVNMLIYPAAILHPSLGCPLIVEEQEPVSLIIVTDRTFRQAFLDDNGGQHSEYAKGGLRVATSIRQHLKIVVWNQARELKQDLNQDDQPLKVAEKDIVCTYLGKLDRKIKNADGKHVANIRHSLLNQLSAFREKDEGNKGSGKDLHKYFSNDGLQYLFQIDLHNLKLDPDALYDSFWVLRNHTPHKADIQPKYLDIQDRLAREYIQNNYYCYAEKEGPKYAFRVTESGVELTPDTDTPIMNHHPIWVAPPGKNKLTIGHLSDVHVSSKQAAYKGRGATVIPGAAGSLSPPIGDMANNNTDNFFDLLHSFGGKPDENGQTNEVDVILITGDLYDHLHNYDPGFKRTSKTSKPGSTGELWEAMYVEDVQAVENRNEEFPCGIDGLTVYSILVDFYTRRKKPVFIITGNHEAYEYPYGISPRLGNKRANEGIPMDHNLTLYEAILLYGPAYKLLIPDAVSGAGATFSGGLLGRMNFSPGNFDWFYTLFTPLTDYWQTYKTQTLIGLGWGDGEDYMWNPTPLPGLDQGGHLPRAAESVDEAQKSLVETALRQNSRDTILCSHFTAVNYAQDKPLSTDGEVQAVNNSYSKCDHGTIKADRPTFHGDWIGKNRISLTLGGHSHRVGLYRCEFVSSRKVRHGSYPQFDTPDSWEYFPQHLKTRGYHPESDEAKALCWDNKTKVLVSASTGPLSKQNREGEMVGWGMEFPAGSRITTDGAIALVKSGNNNAKPRFCVACDYIDVVTEGGFWEFFRMSGGNTFEMKPHWEKIHPKLNQAVKTTLIKSVALCFVRKKPIVGSVISHGDIVKVAFPASEKVIRKIKKAYSKGAMFLSINFNGKELKMAHPGFEDYDYSSPWNIQVGIYDGKGEEVDFSKTAPNPSQWQIMRHKKFGEVPDHKSRTKECPKEYGYKLN